MLIGALQGQLQNLTRAYPLSVTLKVPGGDDIAFKVSAPTAASTDAVLAEFSRGSPTQAAFELLLARGFVSTTTAMKNHC